MTTVSFSSQSTEQTKDRQIREFAHTHTMKRWNSIAESKNKTKKPATMRALSACVAEERKIMKNAAVRCALFDLFEPRKPIRLILFWSIF